MIGSVPPANPAPPVFRLRKTPSPVFRVTRALDLIAAKPDRAWQQMRPIGDLGTRIDVRA